VGHTIVPFFVSVQDEATLKVIDLQGRVLYETSLTRNNGTSQIIDINSKLSKGVYLLQLQTKTTTLTNRVVVR